MFLSDVTVKGVRPELGKEGTISVLGGIHMTVQGGGYHDKELKKDGTRTMTEIAALSNTDANDKGVVIGSGTNIPRSDGPKRRRTPLPVRQDGTAMS